MTWFSYIQATHQGDSHLNMAITRLTNNRLDNSRYTPVTAETVQSFSGQRSIAPDSHTEVTLEHSNSSSLALR